MPALGPFDRRTKRSRCSQCRTSHSKCSGSHPCSRCQNRNISCSFLDDASSTSGPVIRLNKGRHFTTSTFKLAYPSTNNSFGTGSPSPERLLPDSTVTYLHYFDVFLQRNNFTGRETPFLADVQNLIKASSSGAGLGQERHDSNPSHLLNAMLALGAMQAHSSGVSKKSQVDLCFALESYAKSISDLKRVVSLSGAVSSVPSDRGASILWSTFFLGLFELMQDPSGQRWLQHMVYGTSQALVALGPSACGSGLMHTFFVQARTFEVCRSIIFNEPSFLSANEWMQLTQTLTRDNLTTEKSFQDAMLDLIVSCSDLRVRTARFVDMFCVSEQDCDLVIAQSLAAEGFCLREALEDMALSLSLLTTSETPLLTAFHAATSIYLSGNYDYDLPLWQSLNINVPVLGQQDIARHFNAIIDSTTKALKEPITSNSKLQGSRLSPLLFLFPLRVAGARPKALWQREAVTELLSKVKEQFIVAEAFLDELKKVWAYNQCV